MLPVGAELFNSETRRQFKQDESSSFFRQDEAFFLATLQVLLSIVQTRHVRHRGNSMSQEWKDIIDARTSSCKLSLPLVPVYAKIRIY